MEKKIVLLKDLDDKTIYPVLDLVKSEGERLGCATTSLVNFIMKLNLFKHLDFSNVAEMALYYEMELQKNDLDGVEAKKFFEVIDELTPKLPIEKYILKATTADYGIIQYLLANDFIGLVCSNTPDGGHCDIFFRNQEGRVFYNAIEVNEEELGELLFSHPANMILLARNLEEHPKLFMRVGEMANLTFKLSEADKYMLKDDEIFYIENTLLHIVEKYPAMETPAIIREKELALKKLGFLSEETIIID